MCSPSPWVCGPSGYYFLALGACFECSVEAAVTYAVCAAVLIPLLVLWLVTSALGRLQVYLRRLRRPSLIRLLITGIVWGLGLGLVVFVLTGSAWRIAAVLAAWMVFFLAFPPLFGGLYGRELELR